MGGRGFTFVLILLTAACMRTEPERSLPPMTMPADEVHVVARVGCNGSRPTSGYLCHVIANDGQIEAIKSFMNARLDGWSTPMAGPPVHPVRIEFYSDGELVEAVGLSHVSAERDMFLSRGIEPAEVDEMLRLIGLDRSHLRFRADDAVPE